MVYYIQILVEGPRSMKSRMIKGPGSSEKDGSHDWKAYNFLRVFAGVEDITMALQTKKGEVEEECTVK